MASILSRRLDISLGVRYRRAGVRAQWWRTWETATASGCSGRMFPAAEITLIREVVATCRGLSRRELANTISELVGWTRPNGSLKEAECLRLLARLEAAGLLSLPAKQPTRPVGSVTSIPHTAAGEPGVPLSGRVERFAPVCVERVADAGARQRFRELVGRYHTLGYKVPFGAHLQYLVSITQPVPTVVGGLQFSSAAWRMQARDRWIGWDDATRARHLPQVVNNSRLLLLPWVQIKNLASATLAHALRRLAADWVEIGETSGRGRDDRQHRRHGARPKRVFVFPLRRDALARLRGDIGRP